MNERSLRVLEFTKIRSQLAQYCVSDMGQAPCDGLTPSSQIEDVRRMQQETEEAHSLLAHPGGTPMHTIHGCAHRAAFGADRFVSVSAGVDGCGRLPSRIARCA